jgi:hypothetical protein
LRQVISSKADKSKYFPLFYKVFISKAERDYLLGKEQTNHDYVCVKSRLNKKLKAFVDQELLLLLEKGYLSDIAEFRNIAENCKIWGIAWLGYRRRLAINRYSMSLILLEPL